MRPRGICAFCGEPGSSEEDVLAKWIAEALGGPGEYGFNLGRTHGRSKTNTRYLAVTSRAPCERCNNEWMSQVEQASKPLLTPIIRGIPTRWETKYEQTVVAQWIFKTALMIDRANPPDLWTTFNDHFRYLYDHRKPPPSATISLANYVPAAGEQPFAAWMGTAWSSGEWQSGAEIKGYRVTFSVGHAIFQVYAHTDTETEGIVFERNVTANDVPIKDAFRQLWPLTSGAHEWPPMGATFSTSGLLMLEQTEE